MTHTHTLTYFYKFKTREIYFIYIKFEMHNICFILLKIYKAFFDDPLNLNLHANMHQPFTAFITCYCRSCHKEFT